MTNPSTEHQFRNTGTLMRDGFMAAQFEDDAKQYPKYVGQLYIDGNWHTVEQARELRDFLNQVLPDPSPNTEIQRLRGKIDAMVASSHAGDGVVYMEHAAWHALWSEPRSPTDTVTVCETCKGRRFYTVHLSNGSDADDQPCPDCNPNGDSRAAP